MGPATLTSVSAAVVDKARCCRTEEYGMGLAAFVALVMRDSICLFLS